MNAAPTGRCIEKDAPTIARLSRKLVTSVYKERVNGKRYASDILLNDPLPLLCERGTCLKTADGLTMLTDSMEMLWTSMDRERSDLESFRVY